MGLELSNGSFTGALGLMKSKKIDLIMNPRGMYLKKGKKYLRK